MPAFAQHGTLASGVITAATLTAPQGDIEVFNQQGSAPIYFTINGATPAVGGNDTYVVPAAICSYAVRAPGDSTVLVQMISASGVTYSVVAPPANP